jgi:serine/threonine protein kinase
MATDFKVDHVVYEQIRHGDLELTHMSDELAKLLRKMLSADPAKRPSAMEILRGDRIRRAAASHKIQMPSDSAENLPVRELTIEDSGNSGNTTSDETGETEQLFVNKENVPAR